MNTIAAVLAMAVLAAGMCLGMVAAFCIPALILWAIG